jgi:general secretion pathway protein D
VVFLSLNFVFVAPKIAASEPVTEVKTWRINLRDADLRTFIGQVSDITGYSFVVDPRIKGKVTIVSNVTMAKASVFELFHSVLNVHGFAVVPSGGIFKIIPNQNAKQDAVPLAQGQTLKDEALVTRVVSILNTRATELVPILRPLIPQHGHLAGVESVNALIVSDHASNIQRILDIIARIDTAENEGVEVVQLREAWVGDVVSLLRSLEPVESGNKKSDAGGVAGAVTVVADERANRLIIKGEPTVRARVREIVTMLDKPTHFNGATKVIYLRYADANKVAEMLKNMDSGKRDQDAQGGVKKVQAQTQVQADETLNALIIRAPLSEMGWMEEIVRQLDIRRAQVLIEAAIVEVSGGDSAALGVQWASLNKNKAVGGISFSNLGTNLDGIISAISGLGTANLADGISLAAGEQNTAGDKGFGALLQAITASSNSNLLSTPSIMTLDNEEAEIVVGQNVPFVTGSTTNTNTGTSNPFQTISREDVGLTLKVVPQINEGNVVRLQIEQEVSSVVPSSEAIQSSDLITNKRAIKTTILANDGETIVLGGLIQDDFTESEQRVPVLGRIPLLGRLFKSKNTVNVKRNLLVFLKPRIMRDTAQAKVATQEKYHRVRTIQLEINQAGNIMNLIRQPNTRLPASEQNLIDGVRE